MESLSSLGVGSGLDLGSLVQQLVQAERAPTQRRLDRREADVQADLSALGRVKSAGDALEKAIADLQNFATPHRVGVSGAGADAVSARLAGSGSSARPAVYTVEVSQLASTQSLASEAFSGVDAAVGTGSLTLQAGGAEAVLELGGEVATIADLRDAINDSDAGIQAALVQDGGGVRLLLSSATTGTDGTMTLTVDGTVDARLASAAMTETRAAADASYSINGLALTSSSNVIEDVLPDLTLELAAVSEGPATVAVERDSKAAAATVEAVVKAYNELRSVLSKDTRFDPETGAAGALAGDAFARSLQARLTGAFGTAYATEAENNPFASLVDVGVRLGASGSAELDTARFAAALAEDPAGLEALLSAFGEGFGATLAGYVGTGGVLDARRDGLDRRLELIEDSRSRLDLRMEKLEARLRREFTALDTLVSQFQNTSNFLASQLAGLNQ